MSVNDYTLGSGKLLLKLAGANGFRDLGNIVEFSIAETIEKISHYTKRSGFMKKDHEVIKQLDATGKFTLDEPVIENLRYFVMAPAPTDISQSSSSWSAQSFVVYHDLWIDLGKKTLTNVVVNGVGGSPTYVLDTDYEIDVANGLIKALSTGAIADGGTVEIDGDYASVTIQRLDAAQATTMKGDIYFAGDPAAGRKLDVKGYVSLFPEGDLGLITEDWLQMPFTMEFLESTSYNGLFELIDKGVVT